MRTGYNLGGLVDFDDDKVATLGWSWQKRRWNEQDQTYKDTYYLIIYTAPMYAYIPA